MFPNRNKYLNKPNLKSDSALHVVILIEHVLIWWGSITRYETSFSDIYNFKIVHLVQREGKSPKISLAVQLSMTDFSCIFIAKLIDVHN